MVAEIVAVVQSPENRLDEEEGDEDGAKDGMSCASAFVELGCVSDFQI